MEKTSTASDLTERLRRRLKSERRGDRGVDRERARKARRELAARREERAAYHRARYGAGDRADARTAAEDMAPTARRRPESLDRYLRRKLGDDALVDEEHPRPESKWRPDWTRDIGDARQTLTQLEVDTWGIVFHEIKGERFVVVPEGALADPPWRVDERPAFEAIERVKELYDRVRGAVDEGLSGGCPRSTRRNSGDTPGRSKPCGGASSGNAGRTKPCGSMSSGRPGRTKPCRCESSGWTGK